MRAGRGSKSDRDLRLVAVCISEGRGLVDELR